MHEVTILVFEDNYQDLKKILSFIGGDALENQFKSKVPDSDTFDDELDELTFNLKTPQYLTLSEPLVKLIGPDIKLKVTVLASLAAYDRFRKGSDKTDSILLCFLDLNIPDAEEIRLGNRETENIALNLFKQLLDAKIPVFVLSNYIDEPVFERLSQMANGRLFGFRHKKTFFKSMAESEYDAQKSEANFITSLIYTKPFYHFHLRLKNSFKKDFEGSHIIAHKLRTMYEPNSHRAQKDHDEQIATIKNDLRKAHTLSVGVKDEVSTLKAVVLHAPGSEIELVTPRNYEDLLFNQPVNAEKFSRQYTQFRTFIDASMQVLGGRAYTVQSMLKELLGNNQHKQFFRAEFILEILQNENEPGRFWDLLEMDANELIEIAIFGTTKNWIKKNEDAVFDPIPNFLFTRDWAFTIHDKIFLSNMKKKARRREQSIAQFILRYHPLFHDCEIISLKKGTIEGGDVVLASPQTILIGLSDRTEFETVQEFVDLVFLKINSIEKVVATYAPLEHPKSMHLDTFMGFLDRETVLLDKSIMIDKENPHFIFERRRRGLNVGSFREVLKKELGELNIIEVQDKNEQYDDACNVFALAPGKVLIYERVPKTIEALKSDGWEDYDIGLSQNELSTLLNDDQRKVLIKIPGDELALARGGPHCMTFPISREG